MTVQQIVDQALGIAGNTGLSSTDALNALNNFLQAEYRRKYPDQRKTVTLNLGAGVSSDSADWDTSFLDLYQQQDGSVGRYVIPGSTAPGYIAKTYALDYRAYIALADRLTATGPPRFLVADAYAAVPLWYVYPVTDLAYTVTVDIYSLPALLTLGGTPPAWIPDELYVQIVKVWSLEWQQDDRLVLEKKMLVGDDKAGIPGMLPTFRRRKAAQEGRTLQTALDQRVYQPMASPMPGDSGGSIWD